jgi:hypothetical protein
MITDGKVSPDDCDYLCMDANIKGKDEFGNVVDET